MQARKEGRRGYLHNPQHRMMFRLETYHAVDRLRRVRVLSGRMKHEHRVWWLLADEISARPESISS